MNQSLTPQLNDETIDLIESYIANRNYNDVIDICIQIVQENIKTPNREQLYEIIEKITLICDKTPFIVDTLVPYLGEFLQDLDEWLRTESLIITERISKYRPNVLIEFIPLITNRLQDEDQNNREIALNIIGNLSLNLHLDRENLFIFILNMMQDKSWKIRIRAIQISEQLLKKEKIPNKNLFQKYVEGISKLVGDEDEEVQGTAIETLKNISFLLDSESFLQITSQLVNSSIWQISEKGIWLVGEVGADQYSNVSLIAPRLPNLLNNPNLMIQTKVIDALVKIGRVHTEKILEIIFNNVHTKEKEIYDGLFDIFLYLGIERPDAVLQRAFEHLEDPDRSIRMFISDVLNKFKEEAVGKIEEQVASLFARLRTTDWRQRQHIVEILGSLNGVIKVNSIAVWSYLTLKSISENEVDPEVKDTIHSALERIQSSIDDIEIIIREVEVHQNFFYREILELQNLPKQLRDNMLIIIEKNEFREALLILEREINKAIKKIESFGDRLDEYEYKRLAVDLIEDWSYTRLDLLEQIGDIKNYIKESVENAKQRYITQLYEKIQRVKARIDVLKSEMEDIINLNSQLKHLIQIGEEERAKKKLEHLAYIRDKIFRLEAEIGQIWIENLDFKEELKDITLYWVNAKIEAQQLLYSISYNLKSIHTSFKDSKKQKNALKKEISFELLLNQYQNLILQSSSNVRDQFERFSIITSPVVDEIKKGSYDNATDLLKLTISQTVTSIQDFDKEIIKIYDQLDKMEGDFEKSKMIRSYMEDWIQIKDSLIERSNEFFQQTSQDIFFHRIIDLQKYINPIPIDLLSKHLKTEYTESQLLEKLFKLIENGTLQGKIRDNKLYLPEKHPEYENVLQISKKIETLGNFVHFKIRLQNTTRHFLQNLSILFSWPVFMELQEERSKPNWMEIKELQAEEIQIFNWVLKYRHDNMIKSSERLGVTSRIGELKVIIRYTNFFGVQKEIRKELEVFIP
ncbi:MAG: hypothetical protein JW776_10210 [Candidatus Lokiarchaeota archaeon]|nr:hypothetical protein [Candidatus Lokiarchaeota archaeon]